MRRIASIGLIFLIAFQLVGTWGMFQLRRSQIRREVKREIKSDIAREDDVRFRFSPRQFSALDWVKDGEFRLDGKLYDVVQQSTKPDGSVEMLCFPDEKETQLHDRLAQALEDRLDDDPSARSSHSWSLTYLSPPTLLVPIISGQEFPIPSAMASPDGMQPSISGPPPRMA